MQRIDRPATTTFVRYHQLQVQSLPLVDSRVLETIGLLALVSLFWGIILFMALTQTL